MKTPLASNRHQPEKAGGKQGQHLAQLSMDLPDHYHAITATPLREKIDIGKRLLYETYLFIAIPELSVERISVLEKLEAQAESTFQKEYDLSFTNIRNGFAATQQQDHVRTSLCTDVAEDLQNTFSTSFIWLVCADLLEEEGLRDQSWASLVELASLEHRLELACLAEEKLRKRERQKKYGSLAYQDYKHLKEYLIEHLNSESKHGWETKESAAYKLSEKILHRHQNSQHKDNKLSREEVEKRIYNWLTGDPVAKKAFEDNKKA